MSKLKKIHKSIEKAEKEAKLAKEKKQKEDFNFLETLNKGIDSVGDAVDDAGRGVEAAKKSSSRTACTTLQPSWCS